MTADARAHGPAEGLRITLRIGATDYVISRLDPDPMVAHIAYRIAKHEGDQTGYDVRVDEHGPQCECLGFLRWNRPCKHIRALRAAGLI
jgi:hypothetical protein